MGSAISEVLPAAIGVVFVNPVPIMAVILMLLSPRAKSTAPMFVAGWAASLLLVLGLLLFAASPEPVVGDDKAPSTLSSVVRLLLGLVLLFLAFRQWKMQPKSGEVPAPPPWMLKIDRSTPAAALGLGTMMSGVNPKNLALNLVAVVAIAQAHLTTGGKLIQMTIYALLASAGVLAPVIWYFAAPETATKALTRARAWLTANHALIIAIVLFLFGFILASGGIGELIG